MLEDCKFCNCLLTFVHVADKRNASGCLCKIIFMETTVGILLWRIVYLTIGYATFMEFSLADYFLLVSAD